jgi:Xaa-Pro aminopeptidase
MVKPGVTIDEIHNHCVRRLTEGMIELGLLSGSAEDRVADQSYRKFYMHGTSHWLGLDVHDVGAYTRGGKARPLEAGMVITVEPGMYVAADAPDVPAELRGIGIRIEDDVVVTATGHDVLTASCPKKIEDIEAACRG